MLSNKRVDSTWQYVAELNCFVSREGFAVVLDIRDELTAEQWLGHQHGDRNLYKKGCHGPLCRKAMRDYGRRYQRERGGHVGVRRTKQQAFDPLVARYTVAYRTDQANIQERRQRMLDLLQESVDTRPKLGVG